MTSPDDKTAIARQPPEPEGQPTALDTGDVERSDVMRARAASANAQHALPIGTRIAEFEIRGLIGEGGFGIVYLAHDTQLGRNVALKEYFPASLASRVDDTAVTVKSERHEETFHAGLKSFINEARLLAQFDHQSLVKVYRFWEANGTAYLVMPYYEGVTLQDALQQMPSPPDEAWLRGLLKPLIEALTVLHGAQCYHRDIAPDNVILLKGSGRPLLLDFGAARRVIGDMTQTLTVILKTGYAPVEQYGEVPSLRQGAWTDIYALAAVVYFAIEGKTPPTAVWRLMTDTYVPLATAAAGRYSEPFLRAIDHALAVRPQDRPQDVFELAAELGIAVDTPDGDRDVAGTRAGTLSGAASAEVSATATDSKRKRPATIAAVAVGVVMLAIGGWFAMRPPAAPSNIAPAASTPAPLENAPASPAGPTAQPAVEAALPSYTPGGEFDRIVLLADPALRVTTTLRSTVARINRDHLQFKLSSNRAGYAYVFVVDPDGQYLMLFPNELDKDNAIAAGQTLSLPRAKWPMLAGPPAGPNRFLALVSPVPRDFADGGLHHGSVFASFPADAQRDAAARRTANYSPFAGKPKCAAGGAACPDTFGASTFKIDVVNASK